ncbi:hypothetical protein V8C42DRAFT_141645 [Trichoderma barbatum]
MSQATSLTFGGSTVVEKKRNWTALIISLVVGEVIAVLALLAIASLMPPGTVRFIAGTTLTGIMWGIATKVTGNILGLDDMTFTLHQYPIQQSYRNTIKRYIGTTLENVITSIRTNTHFELQDKVRFDIDDQFRFDINEKCHMFFDLSFKVIPRPGTSPRLLHQGASAPDLPNHDPQSTQTTVIETKSLAESICHGIQQGALVGLTNGSSASLLFLVLGKAGIVFGVIGATRLLAQINHLPLPTTAPRKIALSKEFTTEVTHHINRLKRCAADNTVGFELAIQVWTRTVHPQNGVTTRILQSTNA